MNKITQFFKNITIESNGYELLDQETNIAHGNNNNNDAIINLSEALNESCVVEDSCSSSNTNIVIYIDKPQKPVIGFPRDKEKRRFQAQWYNEFLWLEYEISTDTASTKSCKCRVSI